ncbi:hypothetical protein A1O3_07260 [Capronia epimyces CBS 606.96]|uniref:Solute carrier family 40 member n=1 Tax=Capronia epimyces CBS 606.96 TaxID=1182542 RepID=W9XKD8_9EURO|nr:uncharacterized protein A1O3_07260 [Capronia epimyces CBS 606.96]EXJ80972.1 hypothetical protein A1O3_07260 [Capronia epimyces CBS 606.96]
MEMESRTIAPALYVSHFLSMWNARGFEFGAVLFLASIYPGTLLPVSIYALIRALAAVCLSPILGRFLDSGDRLRIIRLSIVGQRLGAAVSCLIFALLVSREEALSSVVLMLLLGILVLLACIEKLSSITNTVAVERDWVVVIAADDEALLQTLNAQMRRIDLVCKLAAPLAIALLHGWSPIAAVWTTLATNALSVGIEYLLIARVFHRIPALRDRSRSGETTGTGTVTGEDQTELEISEQQPPSGSRFTARYLAPIVGPLSTYVRQSAFLPSLALSVLYLTVLSFSGQMTTFLLGLPEPRITSTMVGMLRTISTMVEISSTFIAPKIMSKIGPVRAGIWFLSWQTACSSVAVGLLWTGSSSSPRTVLPLFIGGIILSRFGLWSFDLCAQLIIQESILPPHRGTFSAVEMSLQNFFELCAFVPTIIFPRPDQFRYPAVISLGALYLSAALYAKFVRDRRGHLLHMPSCLKTVRGRSQPGHAYQSLATEVE